MAETKICPQCGVSEMWDNRAKKASGQFSPKSPDYSCKDKDCAHVIWPEKKAVLPNKPFQRPSNLPTSAETPSPVREQIRTVDKSAEIAREAAGNALAALWVGTDVSLQAFIEAAKTLSDFYITGVNPLAEKAVSEDLSDEESSNLPF